MSSDGLAQLLPPVVEDDDLSYISFHRTASTASIAMVSILLLEPGRKLVARGRSWPGEDRGTLTATEIVPYHVY